MNSYRIWLWGDRSNSFFEVNVEATSPGNAIEVALGETDSLEDLGIVEERSDIPGVHFFNDPSTGPIVVSRS